MNESREMYLKTICKLNRRMKNVRAIDIAKELNYSKPSVSNATKTLKDAEYIEIDENSFIRITDKGKKVVSNLCLKYNIIREYLIRALNLEENDANENACLMEHIITDSCLNKMKDYLIKN